MVARPGKDIIFFCTDCGHESSKWLGQCPGCGAWNSFVEEPKAPRSGRKRGSAATPVRRGAAAVPVTEAAAVATTRTPTGLDGVDRVLGGGLVPGSLVLVAGEPGVGKSTLLLQVAAATAANRGTVIYVTGEESSEQVALRARRIGGLVPELLLLPETSCDAVMAQLEASSAQLIVVDSIQTLISEDLDAVAGSVSQVRQVAARFQHLAKTRAIPVVLVGHVTKEGHIAGPKLLEHLVDVVLSLEGEPGHDLRVLRAGKNRFGTVAELALYSMTEKRARRRPEPIGVAAGGPPARAFRDPSSPPPSKARRRSSSRSRRSRHASALGTPRRVAQGFDGSRLALLVAVIERHAGIRFTDRDIYPQPRRRSVAQRTGPRPRRRRRADLIGGGSTASHRHRGLRRDRSSRRGPRGESHRREGPRGRRPGFRPGRAAGAVRRCRSSACQRCPSSRLANWWGCCSSSMLDAGWDVKKSEGERSLRSLSALASLAVRESRPGEDPHPGSLPFWPSDFPTL